MLLSRKKNASLFDTFHENPNNFFGFSFGATYIYLCRRHRL